MSDDNIFVKRLDIRKIYKNPRPTLEFVLPGMLAGTVALLVGPGGVSKSYLALQTAISIALGRDIFHLWSNGEKLKQGKAVVLSLEDTEEVLEVRVHDILHAVDLTDDDLDEIHAHLHIMPLYGCGVVVGVMDPKSRQIFPSEQIMALEKYLQGSVLTVLDTFNRSLGGLDENSSGQMGPLLSIIEGICRRTKTAFLILHHTNKASTNEDRSGEQNAIRGASAITDNARWQTNLSTMNKKEAANRGLNVEDGEHKQWVQVDLAKVNYGPPIKTRWLNRAEFGVLNGWDSPPDIVEKLNDKKSDKVAPINSTYNSGTGVRHVKSRK